MFRSLLSTALALVVLSFPTQSLGQSATCAEYVACDNDCADADLLEGIELGAVDSIGELLCFTGDFKCPCFQSLTDIDNPSSQAFSEWQGEIERIARQCSSTGASNRSLSGIAFEAATRVCTPGFGEVERILAVHCDSCHKQGGLGGFQYAGREDLVNKKSNGSPLDYVKPGNLEESYLYRKIEGTQVEAGGMGGQMPSGSQLDPKEIDTIKNWILGGANP